MARSTTLVCLLGLVPASLHAQAPLTRAERSGFLETSRYADVMAFLRETAEGTDALRLDTLGYSLEGRPIPLVVWPGAATVAPGSAAAGGKTVVYLQGNIHGGEVEGKEALLAMVRELAGGAQAAWADSLVLLIAPLYNADGNERIRLDRRPLQHGPFGGMGQRPNAQGLDLNRDHMKLEAPEARALARALTEYDPHVVVDLHATNGTHHAYHITYAPPLHPATDTGLIALLRSDWLPEVSRRLREADGTLSYYYGNIPGGDFTADTLTRGWYTFDHRARFNNNYVGLRNRFAILGEAYAYLPFEDRIRVTARFVEAVLDFAWRNGARIRAATRAAERASLVGERLPLSAARERTHASADILLGEVAHERHPFTGEPVLRRLEVVRVESMPEFGTFLGSRFERVPRLYLLPPDLGDTAARLEAHGVRVRRLDEAVTLPVERFRIRGSDLAEREFQGRRARTLEGDYEALELSLSPGTWLVDVAQPLGRLAFLLLEPRSDDGFVHWGLLDSALEGAVFHPVLRSFEAPPE